MTTSQQIDKPTLSRAFNTLFFDFVNDIISVTTENVTDLVASKHSVEIIKQANPSLLIKLWYSYFWLPYHEMVNRRDIRFICETDVNETLCHVSSKEVIEIIEKIRKPIRTMTDANKEHSMNFLERLCKLAVMYDELSKKGRK